MKLPQIRPIGNLARAAGALVARARAGRERAVLAQRRRDATIRASADLHRNAQGQLTARMVSPRLVNPDDAIAFRMRMERDSRDPPIDAGV